MLTAFCCQDCCLCQVDFLQVLILEVHEVQRPQLALLVVPPVSRGLRRLLDHGCDGLVALLYQRLQTQNRHFTKLCKLVYPWGSVCEIQSIKETQTMAAMAWLRFSTSVYKHKT